MGLELKPITPAGERFIAIADSMIDTLRDRADEADRLGEMNVENFAEIRANGLAGAAIPEEFGGMGLTSIHDWMAGIAHLARGDGSVAITLNMHLAVSRNMALAYNNAKGAGNDAVVQAIGPQLEKLAKVEMFMCATATEPGTDNLHPLTEAVRTDDGWEINGLKMFVTGSPIATHIAMNLRVKGAADDGGDMFGGITMPIDTPGIVPQDDWDALGMRASGSQAVRFEGVRVPSHMVGVMGPWGRWSVPVLMNRNIANMPLLGAFLGIAEHAFEIAVASATKTKKEAKPRHADRSSIQTMIAEIEIALATARSILAQTGRYADDFLAEHASKKLTLEAGHELLKNHQSMKWVVNKNAIDIVSKAMDIVGGSAFTASHPLSRLYRDVRAGPFMQPYAPAEAREYIGKIALGIYTKD